MSEETISGDVPATPEPGNTAETEKAEEKVETKNTNKVDILLNATGNVPIMKKRKWAVDQDKQISWIMKFIHKYLKLDPEEKIFLYVNQTFAPSPDQIVKNLYECYGTNGTLVLYYCKSQAWG
ncbi:autophagy protein 12-like [Phlebotomus papatasi]|uniref:autophagy protein 12-like n=1 Tax=Phlebotomus papatasi TaxID=29031 RepID=UPI0024842D2A|nr:autophagy protein 12-like [Phlebotomus papatasi]